MQREKRALYLINGVYWITMGMYFPFISTFFLKRGMDTLQIGILTSISPVAAIAVQPLWARLADRTGKRKQGLMGLAAAAAVMIDMPQLTQCLLMTIKQTTVTARRRTMAHTR